MKNHWLKQAELKQTESLYDRCWRNARKAKSQIIHHNIPNLLIDTSQLNFILGKIQSVLSDKSANALSRSTALLQKAVVPIYKNNKLIKVNKPFDHLTFCEWCECDDSELYELMFDVDDDEFDDDILIVGDDDQQGAD